MITNKPKTRFKYLSILFFSIFILSACSIQDNVAPSAQVNSIKIVKDKAISEDELIALLVTKYSDNEADTQDITIDIPDFNELDVSKLGKYDLTVTLTDQNDNVTTKDVVVTVVKSNEERLNDAKTKLNKIVKNAYNNELITKEEAEKYYSKIESLTIENFSTYTTELKQQIQEKLNQVNSDSQVRIQNIQNMLALIELYDINTEQIKSELAKYQDIDASDMKAVVQGNKALTSLEANAKSLLEQAKANITTNASNVSTSTSTPMMTNTVVKTTTTKVEDNTVSDIDQNGDQNLDVTEPVETEEIDEEDLYGGYSEEEYASLIDQGYADGYDLGYNDAINGKEYNTEYEEEFSYESEDPYEMGFIDGYMTGYSDGYYESDQYQIDMKAYNDAYYLGYKQGYNDAVAGKEYQNNEADYESEDPATAGKYYGYSEGYYDAVHDMLKSSYES